jgi:hypothetical protein
MHQLLFLSGFTLLFLVRVVAHSTFHGIFIERQGWVVGYPLVKFANPSRPWIMCHAAAFAK